jgi:hypothetical protein
LRNTCLFRYALRCHVPHPVFLSECEHISFFLVMEEA